MNNFEEVNAETLSQANNKLGSQDNAIASRKLGSGKQSMHGIRQSSQTDLTSGTKESCGSPNAKSDKGSCSGSPSQKSNKKRKIDEISNSENAQTEAPISCGDSVGEGE